MKSGYQELDDGRLYYEVAGSGEPLVLIHAFTLHSGMWDEQVEAFSQDYCVLRFDLRGFGRSSLPLKPYRHIDDINTLLDSLGFDRVHLLGLSMGGGIAVDFALAYPDRLLSLICADANVGGFQHWTEAFNQSFEDLYQVAREQGVEAAKAQWQHHPMFLPALTKPDAKQRLVELIAEYSGWHFLNDDPQLPGSPAIGRLTEIEVPSLIMVGEKDLQEFQEMARLLAALPGLHKSVRFDGVGHMSNLEAPAIFNSEVLGFLHRRTDTLL